MIDYSGFLEHIGRTRLKSWELEFTQMLDAALKPGQHGDFDRWQSALAQLPAIQIEDIELNSSRVTAGVSGDCDEATRAVLKNALMQLHPWRKGPFEICGVHIDTEWRSDWKWDRVAPHLADLQGRKVLDIGCGSGYHLWRMLGAGAQFVVGIDPSLLFLCQFHAIKHFMGQQPAYFLPVGIEALPAKMKAFDTVFSMGVFYHRRSPMDHLVELRELLVKGGELVLETLIIEDELGQVLVPEGRYARMGNVWFLPSVPTMEAWLKKCGFKNIRVVDVCRTTPEEQRTTEWMTFQSLPDFLDPKDSTKSIEGYPGPVRAVFLAEAP